MSDICNIIYFLCIYIHKRMSIMEKTPTTNQITKISSTMMSLTNSNICGRLASILVTSVILL